MFSKIGRFFNSGNARSVRAKKNIVGLTALKGISIICSLLTVPLTIDYVSKYEYGIWLTISSLVSWMSFFDLGIGNGMRNKVIEAMETGRHKLARIYVSTSYAIIGSVLGVVWAIALAATFCLDWSSILNADPALEQQITWALAIAVTNCALLFVLGLNRILLSAIQRPAVASLFDTSSQVLMCLIIFVLIHTVKGSLILLALVMGGSSLVVMIISNIWTFRGPLRKYSPTFRAVRFRMAKGILSMGVMFFITQLVALIYYQTSNLIISHYVGPAEVTVYNVAYKYMNVLTMGFMIVIAPFWSAFAEANVKGDRPWMRLAVRNLLKAVAGFAIIGLIMVACSPFIYKLWLNSKVEVPLILTVLVYLFVMANMWATLWTQLLCGFGKIRMQVICSVSLCIIFVPMAIWGCKTYGVNGIICASILSFLLCTSWFGIVQTRKLINGTARGIWNK